MINGKRLFLLTIISVLCSCSFNNKNSNQKLAAEKQTGDWVLLSEGNNLDRWEMYNQKEIKGWKLINGELQSSGAGWDADEDIITKQSFENFELNLEWKITQANSSGVFFYVQKGSKYPIYESAPEYQIMDDKGWPQKMKPNQYTSASYAMYAPAGAEVKPVGEWNSSKIIVRYPHVEHWLNGVRVVMYELGSEDWKARKASDKWADISHYGIAKSGHIGLQNAGKVIYRNVKIREF